MRALSRAFPRITEGPLSHYEPMNRQKIGQRENLRHFKVQSGFDAFCGAVNTDPVTHNHAYGGRQSNVGRRRRDQFTFVAPFLNGNS